MNWLLTRLREPSTWRGLIWLLAALGVSIRPELWDSITAVGMAVAGLLGILLSEAPRRVDVHLPPLDWVERTPRDDPQRPPAAPDDPDPARRADPDRRDVADPVEWERNG